MKELSVPTVALRVELLCADGRRFVGEVFLPTQSSRHEGPMRVSEWVNTVQDFFPFRPFEGQCRTIFNRHQLVALTVASDANAIDEDEQVGNPTYRVAVEAANYQFQGRLVVEMPRHQQRVVDGLNGHEPFLTIEAGDRHHLIQKSQITRVVEFQEDRIASHVS